MIWGSYFRLGNNDFGNRQVGNDDFGNAILEVANVELTIWKCNFGNSQLGNWNHKFGMAFLVQRSSLILILYNYFSFVLKVGLMGGVTLIVHGLIVLSKVVLDELEKSVCVCRAKEIAVGAEYVQGSCYLFSHLCCAALCMWAKHLYCHDDQPWLVDFYWSIIVQVRFIKQHRIAQSTLRRTEVHTFHRKIGICTAPMGVNNMRAMPIIPSSSCSYHYMNLYWSPRYRDHTYKWANCLLWTMSGTFAFVQALWCA